jgi:hypothetical protein
MRDSCIAGWTYRCHGEVVGKRVFVLGWGISMFLALPGCLGGQTGQPGSLEFVCRPAEPDERIGGFSAEEIVAERGNIADVPFFWSAIPEDGADVLALEPEDAEETRLSVQLELDERADVTICQQNSFEIPVKATLSTEDGFGVDFATTLRALVDDSTLHYVELQPSDDTFEDPRRSPAMAATCFPSLHLGPEEFHGRFCDDERIGLTPTACGGIAQLSPDEAPFPTLEAPSAAFRPFADVMLSYQDLPRIAVSGTITDSTACYSNPQSYAISVDFSIETDGVSFARKQVLSFGSLFEPPNDRGESLHSERLESTEFCGDVSESVEWQQVAADSGSATELCLSVVLIKLEDGTMRYLAEAILEDSNQGWVFEGSD